MKGIGKAAVLAFAAVTLGGCMIYSNLRTEYQHTTAIGEVRGTAGASDRQEWYDGIRKWADSPTRAELDRKGFNTARVRTIQRFGGQESPVSIYYEGEVGKLEKGDLVEVAIGREPWTSYADTHKITKILCHAKDPAFDACAAKYPAGFYDKVTGKRID